MSSALAIWALAAKPGKSEFTRFPKDIKISLVALGETLVDQERSSVKVHLIDSEENQTSAFVLANLVPGKIEAQTVDLVVCQDEEITIEVTGKNTVYLSGNYIEQPSAGDEFDSEDEDEEAYRLEDVSSDVEMLADDFGGDDEDEEPSRFEEIAEGTAKTAEVAKPASSAKRPNESNGDGASKKQKKNKGGEGAPKGDKPQSKAPESKAKPAQQKPESQPAGGKAASQAPSSAAAGQGKKHKKNKSKGNKDA